jgi:hypothetical protein
VVQHAAGAHPGVPIRLEYSSSLCLQWGPQATPQRKMLIPTEAYSPHARLRNRVRTALNNRGISPPGQRREQSEWIRCQSPRACCFGPPGFCCLPVICLGSQNFPSGVPKPASRAELEACSDRTKSKEQRPLPPLASRFWLQATAPSPLLCSDFQC